MTVRKHPPSRVPIRAEKSRAHRKRKACDGPTRSAVNINLVFGYRHGDERRCQRRLTCLGGNTGCLLVADEEPTPVATQRLDQFYVVFVTEAVIVVVCEGHSCRTSTAPTKTHRQRFKPVVYREQPAQAGTLPTFKPSASGACTRSTYCKKKKLLPPASLTFVSCAQNHS